MPTLRVAILGLALAAVGVFPAGTHGYPPSTVHEWALQDNAMIGPEGPVALVWSPAVKRFLSIGWMSSQYDKRAPYTYDELAFDFASGRWENFYPEGKEWGPKFGVCKPPGWKGSSARFKDAEGNVRPNWPAYYWLNGSAANHTLLHDGKFLFYVDGCTFTYDPVRRAWKDLGAIGDPQNATPLKTRLMWGAICLDEARDQVVLFGGGNSDTPRGDPGTWIYSPRDNTWRDLKIEQQPPQRANSPMVYDHVNRKTVLFGGDQLDQTLADTWVFDGKAWTQKHPVVSPSPRAGHALLWLPKAKKVVLLGGYSVGSSTEFTGQPYRSLALEAWTYDERADAWHFIKRFEPIKTNPISPRVRLLHAAVDDDDQIAIVDTDRKLWLCRLDVSTPDNNGTKKYGVTPGAVERRSGAYDPAWYKDVPAADPDKVKHDLANQPVNRWTLRPTPKLPKPNMDWGSAVYSPHHDQILRFSGGHSAYCGTAPQIYDIKTDRYSIPYAPEFPIDWCFTNDQVPGEWSFKGNPWMTGHTYKSQGFDPFSKTMVFAAHNYTYFFDPAAGKWSRNDKINPFRQSFYTTNLVTTPAGIVAWANPRQGSANLWRLGADQVWQTLPIKGKQFGPQVDNSGFAYDARRNRLMFFIRDDKLGSRMAEYSLDTGVAQDVMATDAGKVTNQNFREAIYLANDDLIMIGATGLFYDCAKNAWLKAEIPSDHPPITKEGSYNIGVQYDVSRNIVWALNTNSQVFALAFNRATANLTTP